MMAMPEAGVTIGIIVVELGEGFARVGAKLYSMCLDNRSAG